MWDILQVLFYIALFIIGIVIVISVGGWLIGTFGLAIGIILIILIFGN